MRIPPLRERGDDAALLATRFLTELCARYGILRRFSGDALDAIGRYPWPGNVRELRNRIERAILLGSAEIVAAAHLELRRDDAVDAAATIELGPGGVPRISLPPGGIALEDLERAVLVEPLRMNDHNVSAAARFLRIGRQKLMYRMQKHGISDLGEG